MTTIVQDLRFALRMLRRNPGFTAIAVTVLALGIGANSAIFSLLDAVLFKPLPFADPQRLVMLWERSHGTPHNRVSPLNFVDWSEQNHAFASMAAISGGGGTLIGRDGSAEHIPGQAVTAQFFEVLGVKPIAGRTFTAGDVRPHADAIVLSERLWRSRFDADPNIVGRAIAIDGRGMTVIGVAPADFQILFKADYWTPYFIPRRPEFRQMHFMQVIGRLKPGTPLSRAQAGMQIVAEDIARISPGSNKGWGITMEPLRQALVGSELRATSLVLAAAVGIFGVLAFSVSRRTREFGIRMALGAQSADVLRMVMRDAAKITVAGVTAGLLLAAALTRSLTALLFGVEPHDLATFAGSAALLAVVALAACAAPALRAAAVDPAVALHQE